MSGGQDSIIRRPGKGWRQNGHHVAIWDHDSGMRLHLLGLLRLPNGELKSASKWPSSIVATGCIRVAGGNRKRGLMLWALVMLRVRKKVDRLCGVLLPGGDA